MNDLTELLAIVEKITETSPERDWDKFRSNIKFAIRTLPFINWAFWLEQYYEIFKTMPDENIFSITAKGQILGKKWIYEEMKRIDLDYGIIFVVAGWSGFISRMLLDSGDIQCEKIRSFDINPNATKMAEILNLDWRKNWRWFKSSTQDLTKMNYVLNEFYFAHLGDAANITEKLIESPRTIINTSCEHIESFDKYWDSLPKGLITIIQSTDSEIEGEHVNTVSNIDEFKAQAPMSTIYYAGEREFFHYKRFMLIGER